MVWLLANADSERVPIIVIITYLIGAAHLAHVIAGSVEVLYLVADGSASLRAFFLQFFLPTLAGNVLGGGALVAAIGHAQATADAE
jgi:formate/nitrite transporter FocA (FNT family)